MSNKGQYTVVKKVIVKTNYNVLKNITISSPDILRTTEYVINKVHDKTKVSKKRIMLYTESRYRKSSSPAVAAMLSKLGKTSTLTLWCNVLKIHFKYGEQSLNLHVLVDDKVVLSAKGALEVLNVKVPPSKKVSVKFEKEVISARTTFLEKNIDTGSTIKIKLVDK